MDSHRMFELAQDLAVAKSRGERFFVDLSLLCAQSGVSTDAVRRTLFGGGEPEEVRK